nr:putative toxin-antitoxin system toxin component, PIN family [Fibrella aquatilis]
MSTEILDEYAEILERHYSAAFGERTLLAIDNFSTVIRTETAYRFLLIEVDADDNKFVDAAIAGNADFIVTNDRHFNCLHDIDFPKIGLLDFSSFCTLLQQSM